MHIRYKNLPLRKISNYIPDILLNNKIDKIKNVPLEILDLVTTSQSLREGIHQFCTQVGKKRMKFISDGSRLGQ